MSDSIARTDRLERLVDRHIELSELFEGRDFLRVQTFVNRAGPRHFLTAAGPKGASQCLADLVDRALVTYEGCGFAQDSLILSLKLALVQEINDEIR